MKYQYVKGRIFDAIEALCIGKGDARSRLLDVNEVTVSLLDIHFPPDLLPRWISIQKQMTKFGPCKNFQGKMVEGAVVHTMRRIKNRTASNIAQEIFELHQELHTRY